MEPLAELANESLGNSFDSSNSEGSITAGFSWSSSLKLELSLYMSPSNYLGPSLSTTVGLGVSFLDFLDFLSEALCFSDFSGNLSGTFLPIK